MASELKNMDFPTHVGVDRNENATVELAKTLEQTPS